MANSVQMPPLGESVTEGTVTRWLKQVGDRVEADEPLVEIATDKVDTELPSPVAGTLLEITVAEDETAEVGAQIAVIGEESEAGGGSDDSGSDESGSQEAEETEEPQTEDSGAQEASTEEAPAADSGSEETEAPQAGTGGGSAKGTEITMPALGESVTEGTVTRWLKQVGDEVAVDEPLLEVSTDKVDTEIPSPVAGTVQEILVAEDETAEVGAALAVIGDGSATESAAPEQESAPPAEVEPEPKQEAKPEPEPKQEAKPEPEPSGSGDSASALTSGGAAGYVTPLVRKMAAEAGVDLSSVAGTGVGGRIRKQDVTAAAEAAKKAAAEAQAAPAEKPAASRPEPKAPEVSPKRGTTEKMSRLRRVIAQRMVESLQTTAQLTSVVEVDVTRIAKLRARAKNGFQSREGVKLSFLPFFALAAVEALKAHPVLNSSLDGDQVVYHGAEHLGIAVDTERGLLVPVIKDAGDLNIAGLSRKIADLAERTRTNAISPDELGGGTFTLTNTGSRGALFDTPILNAPQVGILGTGAVVKRPVVVPNADGDESIAVRSMVYLALSYDHRIVDGADAARFLATVKNRLEDGAFEAALGL